ncbi:MAG: NADH-quinone oxidoreductase subunit A [Planctomycetota bacterium]
MRLPVGLGLSRFGFGCGCGKAIPCRLRQFATEYGVDPQRFVGERRVTRAKQIAYEAGSDPVGSPWVRMPVRFYPVAILFLVFDIEVAFLYPWAINYASLSCAEPLVKGTCQAGVSWLGVGTVGFFMAVLLVALAYVWRKRAIGWD